MLDVINVWKEAIIILKGSNVVGAYPLKNNQNWKSSIFI